MTDTLAQRRDQIVKTVEVQQREAYAQLQEMRGLERDLDGLAKQREILERSNDPESLAAIQAAITEGEALHGQMTQALTAVNSQIESGAEKLQTVIAEMNENRSRSGS